MNELETIIEAFQRLQPGTVAALATVVRVEGSAYRRPGARMLLMGDGVTAGTISGGCMESDVRERALRVMQGGAASIVRYDSTAEAERVFGLGLGCNGIVHVLIEPVFGGDAHGPIPFIAEARRRGRSAAMATVIESEGIEGVTGGMRLLALPNGGVEGNLQRPEAIRPNAQHLTPNAFFTVEGDLQHPEAIRLLAAEIRAALGAGRSAVRAFELADGHFEALVEVIAPPRPFLLFGAGHDAQPLARFARQLGWHVAVADHRAAYATTERFPMAHQVVCGFPDELLPRLALDERAVAVVMTHHQEQDRLLLKALLPLPLSYLGILGPRARTERLLDEIEAEGLPLPSEWRERLHAPAGLDIGAETPEEISLSILAEIQAALAGRSGGMLKDHSGPIHPEP